MSEGKILTVSVAAYNVEQYLKKTLDSLICNSMEKLEVLVVDDGSTDGTSKIAGEYEKRYPETFRVIQKENGGYGSTINASIPLASGKYYKQLDGDDWYSNENLDRFIEFLEGTEADLVISPFYRVFEKDGHQEIVDKYPGITKDSEDIKIKEIRDRLVMHELTIRTGILTDNDIRITEKCFYTDNEYVFQPVMCSETIARFPEPVYCYRVGDSGQSVSIESIKKHYRDIRKTAFKIYGLYDRFLKENGTEENGKKRILDRLVLELTIGMYSYYLSTGDKGVYIGELREIDRELKREYPEIYKNTFVSKRIIFLRRTGFMLAPLISRKVAKETAEKF